MSRYALVSTSCAISRDPAENTASHGRMVAEIAAFIAADGWAGVTITHLATAAGATVITVEPGPEALTLDLLRRVKQEMRLRPRHAAETPDGQLSLAVA